MVKNNGVPAAPSGSRASHEAVPSSPEASIPNAELTHHRKLTKYGHFIRHAASKADVMMRLKFGYAQRMARAAAFRSERAGA